MDSNSPLDGHGVRNVCCCKEACLQDFLDKGHNILISKLNVFVFEGNKGTNPKIRLVEEKNRNIDLYDGGDTTSACNRDVDGHYCSADGIRI